MGSMTRLQVACRIYCSLACRYTRACRRICLRSKRKILRRVHHILKNDSSLAQKSSALHLLIPHPPFSSSRRYLRFIVFTENGIDKWDSTAMDRDQSRQAMRAGGGFMFGGLAAPAPPSHTSGAGVGGPKELMLISNHPVPLHCSDYYFEVEVAPGASISHVSIGLSTPFERLGDKTPKDNDLSSHPLPTWPASSVRVSGQEGRLVLPSGSDVPSYCAALAPARSEAVTFGFGWCLASGEVYCTRNGQLIGAGLSISIADSFSGPLHPAVGLPAAGTASLSLNFGQNPFAYNFAVRPNRFVETDQERQARVQRMACVIDAYNKDLRARSESRDASVKKVRALLVEELRGLIGKDTNWLTKALEIYDYNYKMTVSAHFDGGSLNRVEAYIQQEAKRKQEEDKRQLVAKELAAAKGKADSATAPLTADIPVHLGSAFPQPTTEEIVDEVDGQWLLDVVKIVQRNSIPCSLEDLLRPQTRSKMLEIINASGVPIPTMPVIKRKQDAATRGFVSGTRVRYTPKAVAASLVPASSPRDRGAGRGGAGGLGSSSSSSSGKRDSIDSRFAASAVQAPAELRHLVDRVGVVCAADCDRKCYCVRFDHSEFSCVEEWWMQADDLSGVDKNQADAYVGLESRADLRADAITATLKDLVFLYARRTSMALISHSPGALAALDSPAQPSGPSSSSAAAAATGSSLSFSLDIADLLQLAADDRLSPVPSVAEVAQMPALISSVLLRNLQAQGHALVERLLRSAAEACRHGAVRAEVRGPAPQRLSIPGARALVISFPASFATKGRGWAVHFAEDAGGARTVKHLFAGLPLGSFGPFLVRGSECWYWQTTAALPALPSSILGHSRSGAAASGPTTMAFIASPAPPELSLALWVTQFTVQQVALLLPHAAQGGGGAGAGEGGGGGVAERLNFDSAVESFGSSLSSGSSLSEWLAKLRGMTSALGRFLSTSCLSILLRTAVLHVINRALVTMFEANEGRVVVQAGLEPPVELPLPTL